MAITTLASLTRELGSSMSRRAALRSLVAGAAVMVAGGAVLTPEAEGKRRRKNRKGGKRKNKQQNQNQNQNGKLQPGERCQSTSQCVSGYICEVPVNGSNSDTYCSGGPGATCGAPNGDGDDTAPYCAVGYECVSFYGRTTCQAVPDEF
jgi:hypothetical protein